MSDQTDKHMEKITALMVAFKHRVVCDYAARVVAVALAHNEVWPDNVSKDGVLKNAGILAQTGDWKKSEAEDSHGRIIGKYTLTSRSLAETFLKRHEELPPVGQIGLL